MFDYIFGLLTALLATTASVVGLQSGPQETAPRMYPQESTRFEQTLDVDSSSVEDEVLRALDELDRADSGEAEVRGSSGFAYESSVSADMRRGSRENDDEYENEYEDDDRYEDRPPATPAMRPQPAVAPAPKPVATPKATVSTTTTAAVSTGITRGELAKHATEIDCWISFQGTVYDITAIIPWHPGGPGKIIPYCGSAEEFAGAFTRKHGTSMVSIMMKMATKKGPLN